MTAAAHVATRPAAALPSLTRLSLSRTSVELKSFFRRRESVVFTFSLPVVLLIIFGSIFHGTVGHTGVSYRLYFTAGIIASGIMSTTFVNLGISIVLEREDGTLKRLAGTPMPRAAYFAGKALSCLVIAAIEVAIMLGIGVALYGLKLPGTGVRWLTFTWVFLLGVATCTMLGIAVSSVPPVQPERGGRAEPAVPGAAVHLRRVLPVQQPAQGHAAGSRAVPAQMAVPGAARGAPAECAAARRAGAQLGVREGGTGADGLARWKLDPVPENVPLASRQVAMPDGQHAWNRGGVWDAYFAVVLAATLVIILATS